VGMGIGAACRFSRHTKTPEARNRARPALGWLWA
jgi:hypothetical protein